MVAGRKKKATVGIIGSDGEWFTPRYSVGCKVGVETGKAVTPHILENKWRLFLQRSFNVVSPFLSSFLLPLLPSHLFKAFLPPWGKKSEWQRKNASNRWCFPVSEHATSSKLLVTQTGYSKELEVCCQNSVFFFINQITRLDFTHCFWKCKLDSITFHVFSEFVDSLTVCWLTDSLLGPNTLM